MKLGYGLCIDVFNGFEYDELLPMLKHVGFDGFFSGEMYADNLDAMSHHRQLAEQLTLLYETSHATIPGCSSIWSNEMDGEKYAALLTRCIDHCAACSVPILVVHISPDFTAYPQFEVGIKHLRPIVDYAKHKQIRIAFENINSEEYLIKTLDYFTQPHIGFCYDSGHEACHTPGVRFLPQIGERLFCTHLHDNDRGSDQHLIPFDGSIDFEKICWELAKTNYRGNLTLELSFEQYRHNLGKREFLKKSFTALTKINDMLGW